MSSYAYYYKANGEFSASINVNVDERHFPLLQEFKQHLLSKAKEIGKTEGLDAMVEVIEFAASIDRALEEGSRAKEAADE